MPRRTITKAAVPPPPTPPPVKYDHFAELGVSGLKQWGGQIYEDILRDLQGVKKYKKLKEFRENSEVAGALLFVIEQMMRKTDNQIVAFDAHNPADVDTADFIASVLFEDMEEAWNQHVVVAADNFLSYGFSPHEICYKLRGGYVDDPLRHSKFTDNKVGVRRLALRPPETAYRWQMNSVGDVFALEQQGPPDYILHPIPSEKLAHYIFRGGKSNPEGRPLLRNAYPSWVYLTGIKNYEAIGVERDLAGLPVVRVPVSIINDPANAVVYGQFRQLVTNIRNNEQAGIVFPEDRDASGNRRYEIELLRSGGTKAFDTDTIIRRYQHDIALVIIGQWIFFGLERIGTQALAGNITEIFGFGVEGMLDEIAEVANTKIIPKLLSLNGLPLERAPKLKHGRVQKADLNAVGMLLQSLAGAGFDVAGQVPDVVGWMAAQIGFPQKEQMDRVEE